jgi:peptidoglycan/LPS O-acetylase OafA/YrhL
MRKRYYRPELDALRFFAFACVFCDHLPIDARWYEPIAESGAFGMCMFFMLSAYLIITILLRERETAGTIDLPAFAARRVLRIWPLYFFVLFAGYVFGLYLPKAHVTGHSMLAFSFLLGNLYILHHGWVGPIGPLWSLSIEEQFYLVVPAIVRKGGKRSIIAISFAAISLAYIVLIRLGLHQQGSRVVWVNSFVQFQFFAAGGLLALWLFGRKLILPLWQRGALSIVGLAFWLGAGKLFPLHTLNSSRPIPLVVAYLLALLGTFLIFISVLDIPLWIPGPLVYLGKISYGLYVFQAFFLWILFNSSDRWPQTAYFQHHKLIGVPLAFGLTVAISAISYHFFERPILKFKERFETIHTRPA